MSELVIEWQALPMIGLGSDKKNYIICRVEHPQSFSTDKYQQFWHSAYKLMNTEQAMWFITFKQIWLRQWDPLKDSVIVIIFTYFSLHLWAPKLGVPMGVSWQLKQALPINDYWRSAPCPVDSIHTSIHAKSGWYLWYITAIFFGFPQNFRLRTRNQYCTQAIAWGSTI